MAGDGPSDVQNTVTKAQTAALGFRVKSGWAAVVLLAETARSPQFSDIGRIELCDPGFPETRQPYHAAKGKLETNSAKINRRRRVVRGISQQSLRKLLNGYQQKGFRIKRAALVVGSLIDPADIANPHIRAHALEGCLFRSVLEQSLQDHEIRSDLLLERDAYFSVAERLKRSGDDLKRAHKISGDHRWQRVSHGAQSKSLPRLLRCLCSDSRGIAAITAMVLHCWLRA